MTKQNKDIQPIETHPLVPFLPKGTKLLMLGSFPPDKKRWSMDFYYPNLQNDMWRIFGLIFFSDKEHFMTSDGKKFSKDKIVEFLTAKGIGVGDTARKVIRLKGNASDKHLEVVEEIDFTSIFKQIPECNTVVTTGDKATQVITQAMGSKEPSIGRYQEIKLGKRTIRHYRMPSSSRAYPKPLEEKALIYKKMFADSGILI